MSLPSHNSCAKAGLTGSAIRTCKKRATLVYYYEDEWKTDVHRLFEVEEGEIATSAFVSGERKFLVNRQTEADTYDVSIYSHFDTPTVAKLLGKPDYRIAAHAIELEVFLYLDTLRDWTATAFNDIEAIAGVSSEAESLHPCWKERRDFWNFQLGRNIVGVASRSQDPLHTVHEALAVDDVKQIEQQIERFYNQFLHQTTPREANSNRESPVHQLFNNDPKHKPWAECLCETLRQTTLFRIAVPLLMDAIFCSISPATWARHFEAPRESLEQLLKWSTASLLCNLQTALSEAPSESDLTRLIPTEALKDSHPIRGLVERISNVHKLIGQHAAYLHAGFTVAAYFELTENQTNRVPRFVDEARPKETTKVLCFRAPGAPKKRHCKKGVGPSTCKASACASHPCSTQCRELAASDREFLRQLREQQAVLNGREAGKAQKRLETTKEKGTSDERERKYQSKATALHQEILKSLKISADGSTLNATHACDIVGTGETQIILGMGNEAVNRSMGGQWNSRLKANGLRDGFNAAIERKNHTKEDEAFPNFELVVCPRPCAANPDNKKTATPTTP